jgi:hypothetical protein
MVRLGIPLTLAAFACAPRLSDLEVGGADAGIGARCAACPEGKVCDPGEGICVNALPVAAACGALPDGGAVEGLCAAGLSCVDVGGGAQRCARDCSEKEGCTEGRTCYARVGAQAGPFGFCASQARAGELCDATALVFCGGDNLTCVAPSVGKTAGRCFKYCDPRTPDPNPECTAGESCADVFQEDPARGICVAPAGTYPKQCNHASFAFCGRGQTCVRPTAQPFGYCHPRCAAGSCPPGERCLAPGVSFCAAPVARCEPGGSACSRCAAEEDRYCAPEDFCVLLGQARVCKADCSVGQACPEGTECKLLGSSGSSICL